MSKFQIVLLGCFFGGLITFVVLGILHLYVEERREKCLEAENPTDWREQMPVFGRPPAADSRSADHLPAVVLPEQLASQETTICCLRIVIEK